MAKPWAEVANSDAYKALAPEQQEAARNQYFDTVVAPRAPQDKIESVRAQFDSATRSAPVNPVQQDVQANRADAMQEGQLNSDGSAVVRPNGTTIPFGEPTVNDQQTQGFLASQQQPAKKLQLPKTESYGRETIRSLLRGATVGLSDVLGAGGGALGYKALETVGAVPESGQSIGDLYAEMKTKQAEQRDAFREENPKTAIGAEIAGAVAPALLTMGASTPATTAAVAKPAASLGMRTLQGAGIGAAQGGIYGASQADVGEELQGGAEGALFGGAVGAAFPILGQGLKSVISPKASVNPQLQALKEAGVQPTIGQALGGIANKVEQKAQSLPIVGDVIASKRGAARDAAAEVFNNAAINKVLAPIGQKVEGAGQEAIGEAAKKASQAYDNALGKINGVMFDDAFNAKVGELRGLVSNLSEDQAKRFEKIYANEIQNRMSPAGGMIPEAYKKADSNLGKIAINATDRELGDAVKQLQALMKEQMQRSNPAVAGELKAADAAYALLAKVEGAAVKAADKEGIFTPKQLLQAVKEGDKSVRKRATARGEALLQDFAQEGQATNAMLADTVANSGTVDRAAQILSGGALFTNPLATVAGGAGGLAMYSQPVQNALVAAVSKRGAGAADTAKKINLLLNSNAPRQAAITSGGGN